MKVMIAVPTYGEMINSGCHESIVETIQFFHKEFPHIEFTVQVQSMSFPPTARNFFISQFIEDESLTHIFYVDSDMAFRPGLVAKMLAFSQPVVGVICPQKAIDFEAFRRAVEGQPAAGQARIAAVGYEHGDEALVWRAGADGKPEIEVVDGFVRVNRLGTALLMISRAATERMIAAMPELWIADPAEWVRAGGVKSGGLLQCFNTIASSDGAQIGSDVAFSRRWIEACGGELWANVDEVVIRTGTDNYCGHYLTKLSAIGNARVKIVSSSDEAEA
ncbi:hypothetical protein EYW49_20230 [Siculibacillus lacustris]|uniref:Glycosyltransferase n=1 Tax=Siculibacillus lacustris TaxID=1549641 RepID=A0A4Q9VH76_9HYPH|nr:hypothetical protein [Siculibacillus lacustris]TBW33506.1 hypothetical protein EYW49_20230 [Siculibacillus lacustris]